MEMQLFFIPFIAAVGLTSVQPDNAVGAGQKVKDNFRDFFDSIKKNDKEMTETHRHFLEQEAVREQQAFDTMKDKMKLMRQRNPNHRSGDVRRKVVQFKREVTGVKIEKTKRTKTAETMTAMRLTDDKTLKDEKVARTATHSERNTVVGSHSGNVFSNQFSTRSSYCPHTESKSFSQKERSRRLMAAFRDAFIFDKDKMKRAILADPEHPFRNATTGPCFSDVMNAFSKKCINPASETSGGRLRPIRRFFAIACKALDLKRQQMVEYISKICKKYPYLKI